MTIKFSEIKKIEPKIKRQKRSVSDGSGLYLVVEKLPSKCIRFEGSFRYPRGRSGKTCTVPMGIYSRDVTSQKDLNHLIIKWTEVKNWSNETGKHPSLFKSKDVPDTYNLTLKDLFSTYTEFIQQTCKETTWKDRQNKVKQILNYFGEDQPLSDFEDLKKGRQLVLGMMEKWEANGHQVHAGRCRSILKKAFNLGIDKGWILNNPAAIKPETEGVGHTKKSNPTIHWDEVPELMTSISQNSCDGTVLTQLALKLYLMTCTRVGALVRLEWDWFDSSSDMWVIPASTTGLKRKLSNQSKDYDHLIPATPEMHQVMDDLRLITGYQKYVFLSPEGKNYPHLSPSTINTYLKRLGWHRKLTAHGWRDVAVTAGQEVGDFALDIIKRQIGHTDHKQGAIGAYDNTQFLDKRREFLEWWSKELVNQGMRMRSVVPIEAEES